MELDFLAVADTLQKLSLGGISLAVLVVILTEVIKEFAGLEGKAVRAVALGLGFALTAVAYGMADGLIPPSAAPYIEWVFVAVVGGLGGMGLWHLGKRFLSTNSDEGVVLNKLQWAELTDLLEDPDVVSVGLLDNDGPANLMTADPGRLTTEADPVGPSLGEPDVVSVQDYRGRLCPNIANALS